MYFTILYYTILYYTISLLYNTVLILGEQRPFSWAGGQEGSKAKDLLRTSHMYLAELSRMGLKLTESPFAWNGPGPGSIW